MTAFVLVPGAWLGGWAWREVADYLQRRGHEVHAMSLTGLGEKPTPGNTAVNLETHIGDIVDLVTEKNLRAAVLVGHSYGGVPVTGATDRLADHLSHVIYVDSAPIPADTAYVDAFEPAARREIERWVEERGDGWSLPIPSWDELATVFGASLEGLDDAAKQTMRDRAAPQPFATYTQPLRLVHASGTRTPKLAILNTFSLAQIRELIAAGHPWGREMSGPEWSFAELPTGHWPMFSRPADLAAMLHKAAPGA